MLDNYEVGGGPLLAHTIGDPFSKPDGVPTHADEQRRARELVGAGQQAVSAYLLETGCERSAGAEIATKSFAHRLDDVGHL